MIVFGIMSRQKLNKSRMRICSTWVTDGGRRSVCKGGIVSRRHRQVVWRGQRDVHVVVEPVREKRRVVTGGPASRPRWVEAVVLRSDVSSGVTHTAVGCRR